MGNPFDVQIETIRSRFEIAWRNSSGIEDSPNLDDYLPQVAGEARSSLLVGLLPIELAARDRLRRLPEPAYYQFRFPELDPEWLQRIWPAPTDGDRTFAREGACAETRSQPDVTATIDYQGPAGTGTRTVQVPNIPGYKLQRELGRGGMGVVYLARQLAADREVALKIVLSGINASPDQLDWFRREATAAAKLDHPGIVTIYDVGETHGLPYYSMAYVRGKNLGEHLTENRPPPRIAAAWLAEIAEAVEFAHSRGIVHRDLKPANILIDDSGRLRVADFGLAKRLYESKLAPEFGLVVGTPSYMPPEQAQGRDHAVGPRSDVYSLGAILYEMLTGRPPFRAETRRATLQQVIERPVVSPRQLNALIDDDLETICLRCLEKAIGERYPSARFLHEELGRYQRGEPLVARPVFRATKLVRWMRRNQALTAMSVALALLSVLTLGLVIALRAAQVQIDALRAQQYQQQTVAPRAADR